jgi:hypothetical protein
MKISSIALALVTLIGSANASTGQHFRLRRLTSVDEENYSLIQSDDYDGFNNPNSPSSACIQVKNDNPRRNQKLILGDCEGRKLGWKLDDDGLFHTELDPAWCMQAGKAGTVGDGEYVRMRLCDPNEPLQKFVYVNGGGIRPFRYVCECDALFAIDFSWFILTQQPLGSWFFFYYSNQDLCMVWRGIHANVGVDPIIFIRCDEADERNDWSGV